METPEHTITRLRGEVEYLKERIVQLTECLKGPDELLIELRQRFHFTYSEAGILALLLTRPMVTKDMAYTVLYGEMHDAPEPKILDVFICKMRPKLRRLGIDIETIWGRGWLLQESQKEKLRGRLPLSFPMRAAA